MIAAERLKQIQTLFGQAADLPVCDQSQFLKSTCATDASVMDQVLLMLEEDRHTRSLLDHDLSSLANQLLSAGSDPEFWALRDFGPYQLQKLLGEGGMGVVYLACRADLQNLVAIKFLRDAWLSPARRERFTIEQQTLSQLNHPYIARLYDAGVLPSGTPWFVMEYVDGVPIHEYCYRHPCSLRERLQLFRLICEAVQYAHGLAIIHRDIKPSNILVKQDGSVRLLDFGISKQLIDSERSQDQTKTALRMMTPAYAAPEQLRGESVGVFTDVYALGVLLYQLLTGELPSRSSNPAGSATTLAADGPEKPSAVAARAAAGSRDFRLLGRAVWSDLDVLCTTAVQEEPRRRYQSVEALIRDIDHHLNGRALEARPDSLSYRIGKFMRRNARPLAASAATILVVLGLIVFFAVRLTKSRNAALDAAARTQRVERFMLRVFDGNDKFSPPPESLKITTLLENGVREANSLNREPILQADLYQALGGVYQKWGKLDQSDALLTQALDKRRALLGANHPETAQSLIDLGLLRVDQARLAEAERLIRDGLEASKRGQANDEGLERASYALGKVLEARGDYAGAIPQLEQVVRLQSASSIPAAEKAATLKELADVEFYAGRYNESEALTRQALAMHRESYGPQHPLVAEDLINLGAIRNQAGRNVDAEQFYRQALNIDRAWYGLNHPATGSAMYGLGQTLLLEKHFDESSSLLNQALAIQQHVYGPNNPHVANVLNELCALRLTQHQLSAASDCYDQVESIYKKVYGDRHYLVGLAIANKASVDLAKKNYSKAEQGFLDALAHYRQVLPSNHLNIGVTEIKLGRTLIRENRYVEAEQQTTAGYSIINGQPSPNASWQHSAQVDLATIYEHLRDPEKAESFRLAATTTRR